MVLKCRSGNYSMNKASVMLSAGMRRQVWNSLYSRDENAHA